MLALVLAVVGAAAALTWTADRSITRVPVDGIATGGPEEPARDAPPDDGEHRDGGEDPDGESAGYDGRQSEQLDEVVNVLVAGSDRREHLTPEERREYSTGLVGGERTESLILAQVDTANNRAVLLNLPRDLLVTRCDGSRGRINAAYSIGEDEGIGGGSCLVRTVTAWTGAPVHHFVKVDFRGFVDLVDAVNGVTISLEEPLVDERAGLDLPEGCVTLDGADALAFVRARSIDSDYGRIARQQRLALELLDEIVSAGTLANPPRLVSLVNTAARSLEVDEGLTLARMRDLAMSLDGLAGDRVTTHVVPGSTRPQNGVAFLVADEPDTARLFADFANGRLLDEIPADPDEADADAAGGDVAATPSPEATTDEEDDGGTAAPEPGVFLQGGGATAGHEGKPPGETNQHDDDDEDSFAGAARLGEC